MVVCVICIGPVSLPAGSECAGAGPGKKPYSRKADHQHGREVWQQLSGVLLAPRGVLGSHLRKRCLLMGKAAGGGRAVRVGDKGAGAKPTYGQMGAPRKPIAAGRPSHGYGTRKEGTDERRAHRMEFCPPEFGKLPKNGFREAHQKQHAPPKYDTVIVGAVRLVSVLVAAFSVDKVGRRLLLCISAILMFFANLTLGLYIHFVPLHSNNSSTVMVNGSHEGLSSHLTNGITVIPLIATMFFIIGYAMGWGPITWLLMAEVLPLKTRGVVSGLCVLASWLTAFAMTKAFLLVKYGLETPFFFFSVICVVNLIFTYLIPETRGRSLERIESYFRTGRKSFLESFRGRR
nr:solute carrier family 2, facilitated glucose transporter member 6 [Anolis sagrei ordinatus]